MLALARSKFVYIEAHLQKVILLQRNQIAQERWEMHFITKETAWTEFRSVQTESVHTERKKKAAQCDCSDFLTQRSRAHGTVTSDTLSSYKDSCKLNRTQTGLSYKNQVSVTALTTAFWFASQVFSTSNLI